MFKLSAVVLVIGAASGMAAARAADLPSRGPPAFAPILAMPSQNWTGPFVGLGVGEGWGGAAQDWSVSSATLSAAPPIIPVIDGSGSHPIALRGTLVDAEAGYDWQVGQRFVLGVEGDVAWSGLSGSQANGGNVPNYPPGTFYTIQQKLSPEWEASLRARVGFTPIDRLLLYVTGGPAIARLHYTSAFNDYFNESEGVGIRTIKPGWTVGFGAEYKLTSSWAIDGEYLHSEFNPATGAGSTILTDGTTAYVAHSTGVVKQDVGRIGLRYYFN